MVALTSVQTIFEGVQVPYVTADESEALLHT